MKKIAQMIIVVLIFLLSILMFAIAADLVEDELDMGQYPANFIVNERLNVTFVVGEFADSEDVLSLVDVTTSLNEYLKEQRYTQDDGSDFFQLDVKDDPKDELTELYMDVLNKNKTSAANTVLDTSLDKDNIPDMDFVLVGGPCVNWLSAHFLGYPEKCTDGFEPGKGYLRLFNNGRGLVLMVAGYSADDTRRAAHILANYKDYSANMIGDTVKISSAWIDQTKIE